MGKEGNAINLLNNIPREKGAYADLSLIISGLEYQRSGTKSFGFSNASTAARC